jgi:hydroxymethylglutaryl-CoA lyase
MNKEIKIIECPRDAMQGIHEFIPTKNKIDLIKSIIKCGFDTIDCGSFVSSKHIPQLADTPEMLRALENEDLGDTKLLTIVANERGAVRAAAFPQVSYLGYPFSVSEMFQRKNTNASRQDAFFRLKSIKDIADASSKKVVAYISMAFGNPYEEEYRRDEVMEVGR